MFAKWSLIVLFLFILQCLCYPSIKSDLTRYKPTEDDRVHLAANLVSYAGYIEVNQQYGANLYYYFVESQSNPATDPFVLWLQGGPGCSSLFGAFVENGPLLIDANGTLHSNPYSWNTKANVIYIDNPAGTGFSYVDFEGYVTNEKQMAVELYTALSGFLLKHPQYAKNPFYIFGESYAGKYIPSLAHYILSLGSQSVLNLKAIAMGDGWVDPYIQTGSYAEFLYQQKLISWEELDAARAAYKAYQLLLDAEQYLLADDAGNLLLQGLITAAGGVDPYDIRYIGGDPTDPLSDALQTWLSTPAGMKQMNANSTFQACATAPYFGLLDDIEQSVKYLMPDLLANYRVVNYNGNKDLICNYIGTDSWTSVIDWPGQNAYNNAVTKPWLVDGASVGNYKVGGNLTHIIVNNAGHMVPASQPKNSLNMVFRYIDNTFV